MILGRVRRGVIVAAGAWLAGAAAATGGSLLAVSALGQGIAAAPSRPLSVTAVNQALAREATRQPSPDASGGPGNSSGPAGKARSVPGRAVPPPRRITAHPTRHPTPHATRPAPDGTVLSSQGGTVVAGCGAAGAYLISWSPQQGFAADDVLRGPAATARVTFSDSRVAVTMTVSCAGGKPKAATSVVRTWGGDD